MKNFMKKLFFITLLLSMLHCEAQNYNNSSNTSDTMKLFDIKKYEQLKNETNNTSVQYTLDNGTLVKLSGNPQKGGHYTEIISSPDSPYSIYSEYNNENFRYTYGGKTFYNILVGIWKTFDKDGKLVKEINYDEGYKINIPELVALIKKDYHFDLMELKSTNYVNSSYNNRYYIVVFNSDKIHRTEVMIDRTNGEIVRSETLKFSEFKMKVDKLQEEYEMEYNATSAPNKDTSTIYKTYKGKNYTEAEWKIKEQELREEYKRKNK